VVDPPTSKAPTTSQAAQDRRRMLVDQIDDLEQELAEIILSGSDVPDDEHDPEGSTIGFERARVTALLDHARQELGTLERRMVEGDADACVRCGRSIGDERRAALPATDRCIGCAGLDP
jgi:DnaK suppressor protein